MGKKNFYPLESNLKFQASSEKPGNLAGTLIPQNSPIFGS